MLDVDRERKQATRIDRFHDALHLGHDHGRLPWRALKYELVVNGENKPGLKAFKVRVDAVHGEFHGVSASSLYDIIWSAVGELRVWNEASSSIPVKHITSFFSRSHCASDKDFNLGCGRKD